MTHSSRLTALFLVAAACGIAGCDRTAREPAAGTSPDASASATPPSGAATPGGADAASTAPNNGVGALPPNQGEATGAASAPPRSAPASQP